MPSLQRHMQRWHCGALWVPCPADTQKQRKDLPTSIALCARNVSRRWHSSGCFPFSVTKEHCQSPEVLTKPVILMLYRCQKSTSVSRTAPTPLSQHRRPHSRTCIFTGEYTDMRIIHPVGRCSWDAASEKCWLSTPLWKVRPSISRQRYKDKG